MSAPIPFLLCGKMPGHLQACKDIVQPEFEVVQTASSVDAVSEAIQKLLSEGNIRFGVMGGGFAPDDFEKATKDVPGARDIPWLRPKTLKPGAGPLPPGGPPPAETIAQWLRTALDEHHENLKAGKGAGEIWWF